jgi:S-adenosylmethionine:tRNA ribosyltransferase-isomerase
MRVEDFHYTLPDSAIAQEAIEPRDRSMLLDTRDSTDHRFSDLPDLLRSGDLVVVNETRVRAARLVGTKAGSGGEVELLILGVRADGHWEAMARPSRRLRPGTRLQFQGLEATIISGPDEGLVAIELEADDVESAIAAAGTVPLPPYFHGRLPDADRYQTMFARSPGSAAAPTAGLHFTEDVVSALQANGIEIAKIDLHVGADTFRPITVAEIEDHRIHTEWCSLPEETAAAIDAARARNGRVVAVGTTVVRTLESHADENGRVHPGAGSTDLFIKPGYRFRVVDLLVTNFHVPGSTLVVLVAAFMGDRWRSAYETALQRGYRFLSFGDAMLAERA